jgi:hypothetical protein
LDVLHGTRVLTAAVHRRPQWQAGPTYACHFACRPWHTPIYVDPAVANPSPAPCFESPVNFTMAYAGVPHRPRLFPAALIGCLPANFATTRRLVAACLLAPRFITCYMSRLRSTMSFKCRCSCCRPLHYATLLLCSFSIAVAVPIRVPTAVPLSAP